MTPAELRRAASCLEREADALWQCHSLHGHWVLHDDADIAAKADHDEMADLARKLREEADSRGWQPIATAPMDGTRLLLCSNHRRRIADGEFGNYKVWSWPYVMVEPTHWMPLPPGPEAT